MNWDFVKDFIIQARKLWRAFRIPPVTVEYPFVRKQIPVFARACFRLNSEECTGCHECERQCPVEAITIESREFQRDQVRPSSSKGLVFERQIHQMVLDYGQCIFCGKCVEVCVPEALTSARESVPSTTQKADLVNRMVRMKTLPKDLSQGRW